MTKRNAQTQPRTSFATMDCPLSNSDKWLDQEEDSYGLLDMIPLATERETNPFVECKISWKFINSSGAGGLTQFTLCHVWLRFTFQLGLCHAILGLRIVCRVTLNDL